MIRRIYLKERTGTDVPFMSSLKRCHLPELGYAEDEYFIEGTARVYEADEAEKVHVICEDAPYTNRILIRRPVAREKFSGNVVIEILNATARIDLDRIWADAWKFFTRNGDIYVGVTSKSDVLPAVVGCYPERYRDINWSNPMPEREMPEGADKMFFPWLPQYEHGLFWDMLGDLGKLLKNRTPGNPIAAYGAYKVYLTGWSQSTGYVMRWLKSFAYLPEYDAEGPLFDGYLSAGGGCKAAPVNSYTMLKGEIFSDQNVNMMGAREPLIAVNTESENWLLNWAGDSDLPGYLFRTYQFAGGTHDTKQNIVDWYAEDEDLKRLGVKMYFEGVDGEPNDYPYEVLFHAAFHHLYQWVREGIPAPHGKPILMDKNHVNRTDAFGNCLGGIRTAAIDYPTCRYENKSVRADGSVNILFGYSRPFSPAFLKELYGSLDHYRELVCKNCEERVAEGFLLKEDAEDFVNYLTDLARARGLD